MDYLILLISLMISFSSYSLEALSENYCREDFFLDIELEAVESKGWGNDPSKHTLSIVPFDSQTENMDCSICYEELNDPNSLTIQISNVGANCGHLYHSHCLNNWMTKDKDNPTCPNCRSPISLWRNRSWVSKFFSWLF